MKIIKYEKIGNNKYRIYLDNGEVVDTYDEIILKHDLLLKSELTTELYTQIMKETSIVELYHTCVKYISIRIRSTKEIKDYLMKKKISEEDINEVIKRLKEKHLLNDEYFTECFIKDKLNFTHMGEYRIINELKKHNISSDTINKYSYLWDNNIMIPKIEKLVDKQIASNHKLDNYKLRNKIYNYLLNQGYSSQTITIVLNQKF